MKQEKLGNKAAVKGTMLKAHLSWAREYVGENLSSLRPHLDQESFTYVITPVLSMSWVPFHCLIKIDWAIANVIGGQPERVFRELGRRSASLNLGGIYKYFISDEPHRFFDQMTVHNAFQNFGQPVYERVGERSGRVRLGQYSEYSPAFCISGAGFYEEALRIMKAPGPVAVTETSCQCAGDEVCCFDLKW
ncbi:MAG TPA: hypothetical protein VJH03_13950 [Blastocatellia bacterium]|nr:hypothetical protein [Blastocatellia bacterium]